LVVVFIVASVTVQLEPWRRSPEQQDPPKVCENDAPLSTWDPFPERLWIPENGNLFNRPKWVPKAPDESVWRPTFCIVARTYFGHSPDDSLFGIDKFIASIMSQTYKNWYLILLDTDPQKEFKYFYSNLKEWATQEEPFRIRLQSADLESDNPYYKWVEGAFSKLHRRIYWNTDETLLNLCPETSQYFVATNADNWYHEKYLETVYNSIGRRETHLVGVDFSSRHAPWIWQVPKESQTCKVYEKFSPLICNSLTPGNTDLGALVFNASRFRNQTVSFSKIISTCLLPPQDGDGCMVRHLRMDYGWSAERIPSHLFAHAPNPWMCLLYGGVLVRGPVDSYELPPPFDCLTPTQAATDLANHNYKPYAIPFNHTCYQSSKVSDDPDLFSDLPYAYNASGRFRTDG
jgi:hypothetical protein